MKTKTHFIKIINSFALLWIMHCSMLYALQDDTLFIERNDKGKIEFARFSIDEKSERKMNDDTGFLKSMLQAKEGDEFRLIRETTDELGITTRRFQQYFKGVKVENAQYLLHGRNGFIEVMNGDFHEVDIPTVEPSICEEKALSIALRYIGSEKYKWEDAEQEKFLKQHSYDESATYYPQGELVIARYYLNEKENHPLKLSWKFTVASLQPHSLQAIFVDAIVGNIIQNNSLISNSNVTGTAQTIYSGTQAITCLLRPNSVERRLEAGKNTIPGYSVAINTLVNNTGNSGWLWNEPITNISSNWTFLQWAGFSQLQHTLDVHWGAEKIVDYFANVHSRNGYSGFTGFGSDGYPVISVVHSNSSNYRYARWIHPWSDRHTSCFMEFGFGNASTTPWTSVDIVAHEFGHAVTFYTSKVGLYLPDNHEASALNEGFSDIWGICLKNYVNKKYGLNKNLWSLGNEIFPLNSNIRCIRNAQYPKNILCLDSRLYPDTYKGDNWDFGNQYTTAHTNSTVLSHWFYILSVGKIGTNDNWHHYSVTGIGMEQAERIAYRTLLNLVPTSNFNSARTVSIQAAIDLFGICSPEVITATNAWYAVGVGSAYVTPSLPTTQNVTGIYSGTIPKVNAHNINVYNATVKAGARLELDACNGSVIINPGTNGFKIESGASFIIR